MPTAEQNNLGQWKMEVMGMDFVHIYGAEQKHADTYGRFMQHLKMFTTKLFSGDTSEFENFRMTGFVRHATTKLPEDWWEIATKVGEGKVVENNPLKGAAHKDDVYNAFLPAYRAIKENFDKRFKLFSWIFDHARYTAERDSLKTLSGLMQSITGDSKQTLEERYMAYKAEVTLNPKADKILKAQVDKARKLNKAENKRLKKYFEAKVESNDLTDEYEEYEDNMFDDLNFADTKEDTRRPFPVELDNDKTIDLSPKVGEDDSALNRSIDSLDSWR